jgi:hypothetical protein
VFGDFTGETFDALAPVLLVGPVTRIEDVEGGFLLHMTDTKSDEAWIVSGNSNGGANLNDLKSKIGAVARIRAYQSEDRACDPACRANGRDIAFPDAQAAAVPASIVDSGQKAAPEARNPAPLRRKQADATPVVVKGRLTRVQTMRSRFEINIVPWMSGVKKGYILLGLTDEKTGQKWLIDGPQEGTPNFDALKELSNEDVEIRGFQPPNDPCKQACRMLGQDIHITK